MGNEAVIFQSSDPNFSVRTDGSVVAQGELTSLDNPVQFTLTASGPHKQVWETVVQLAVSDPPSSQQNDNEVSYTLTEHEHSHTDIMLQISIITSSLFYISHFLQWSSHSNSRESGQNTLGL